MNFKRAKRSEISTADRITQRIATSIIFEGFDTTQLRFDPLSGDFGQDPQTSGPYRSLHELV